MDSLTQIVLGAAVGEATLGRRVGRKAALWGAVCGTIPDLDVLIPMADPVASFTYHRSFSHSLFVLAALTPLMVWLIRRMHPQHADQRARWYLLVYATFATHVLLDSFTIYGTQIFWPFVTTPMTWGSVFIIDPLFTLPLVAGLVVARLWRHRPRVRSWANAAGLLMCCTYLSWSVAAKLVVHDRAVTSLRDQGIAAERVVALAAPFNTVLWRVVAVAPDSYYIGWHSLLDSDPVVDFQRHPNDTALLSDLRDHWPVQRLDWFTKGFYRVRNENGDVVMTDLRMGVESGYIFGFKVGETGNPHVVATQAEARPGRPDLSGFGELWERVKGN